ncbi:MAG TPA: SMP-30/gluconolactonase/LRE family protein [Tepidisphaeraceae bacterium]|jgi:gluconolactonase|nr:SMP-30/gluconolactonase/LRE family protein [Tepidisphaeraceae bacterium]
MKPLIDRDKFEIFANGLDHPECCAFSRDGTLWAGGEAGQIYRIDPKGTVERIVDLGGFVGGVAFSPKDELYACVPMHGVVRIERNGKWDVIVREASGQKIVTPNYGVFDRAGNYYVTDSGNWGKQNGSLIRIEPSGNAKTIAGPFGYANGLALSADDKTLFMVESNTNRVFRVDLNSDGAVAKQSVYGEDVGRMPDGLVLDSEGHLYVSCYASDDIHRISPDGSKVLFAYDHWAILLSRPTNMAFGGEHFDQMYVANLGRTTITRATVGIRGQKLANQSGV